MVSSVWRSADDTRLLTYTKQNVLFCAKMYKNWGLTIFKEEEDIYFIVSSN